MNKLFRDLEYVIVYIDNILILQREDESDEDHLKKIETVLGRLEAKGFRANPKKSFFMQPEIDYLGYLLTKGGIKPQPKKVEAMHRMKRPNSYRQLKCFLGMVNYYRDMWPRRSHILAPLNDLAGLRNIKPWKWTDIAQQAFLAAKTMLIKEAMLNYPDFTKPFHIHSDASDLQLGAVISQNGKPLAYYTRKLNSAQQNYTVGEKELLGIVEGLKAFENILRGQVVLFRRQYSSAVLS